MTALQFTVDGTPVPKGSARYWQSRRGKISVTHDNARTKPWQQSIVAAAVTARRGRPPLPEAVALALRFFMPRPKSAPRRVTEPTTRPDLDKLIRTVKDGLTRAGVYRDDAQVVLVLARKEFAGGRADPAGSSGVPRVVVHVEPLGELASLARVLAAGRSPGPS